MSIIRGDRPQDNFVMISNAAMEDRQLSLRAKGLLAYLLSRPPGWSTSAERLATQMKEGRDALRAALKELEGRGYLERKSTHDSAGKWTHNHHIKDTPMTSPDTGDGKPGDGEPAAGLPAAGLPADSNKTEPTNTEDNKNDLQQTTVLQDTTSMSPTDCPIWFEPVWFESGQAACAAEGINFTEAMDRFVTYETDHGRKPRGERFVRSWIVVERNYLKTGELPSLLASRPTNEDEAFNMFWEAYPKKERRPVARAAFKEAAKKLAATGQDPMIIITGAKGYGRKVLRDHTEEQYMKSPTNWLNDEQWLDKYPSAVTDMSRTAADY